MVERRSSRPAAPTERRPSATSNDDGGTTQCQCSVGGGNSSPTTRGHAKAPLEVIVCPSMLLKTLAVEKKGILLLLYGFQVGTACCVVIYPPPPPPPNLKKSKGKKTAILLYLGGLHGDLRILHLQL
ncbi:uncharacterized protein LOC120661638 isoform X2 [Panicum virgatum]|uniref:uncharacterized protein LOC120661638 isoform X2 n=1 Tax=Panicum virgatum TaxID=38727 RepID=UPI0019D5DCD7|nr:uncharacterized protein LOC120661638 isoform X2 [Panicum virgatum]